MNKDDIPSAVFDAVELHPEKALLTMLQGSWQSGRIALLEEPHKQPIVVKRWKPEIRRNAIAEVKLLDRIARLNLTCAAQPILIEGNYLHDTQDASWTIQHFVRGEALKTGGTEVGFKLGKALAELHVALWPPATKICDCPSSISHLSSPPFEITAIPQNYISLVTSALKVLEPTLSTMVRFPHCQIHGDLTFENIIYRDQSLAFVDWEYSRIDMRLLDLGAAIVGARDTDGSLCLQPSPFISSLVKGYTEVVRTTPQKLSESEYQFLPLAALAFLLRALSDQISVKSNRIFSILPAIQAWLTRYA